MSRDAKLALALFVGSLVVLLALSARTPLGPANSDYAALVIQAEDVVRAVADSGFASITNATGSHALEVLGRRPLAPLLSAWSALSIGRLGWLDGSTSVRLPWLLLAALMPPCVFLQLRARVGVRSAALGGAWLLACPGFAASALALAPETLAAWGGWLVLGIAVRAAVTRSVRERCACWCIASVASAFAFGLSFAALWVLPFLIVREWVLRGRAARVESEHGAVPVSVVSAATALAVPVGVIAFDPRLWHSAVPALIRRIFEEDDALVRLGTQAGPGVFAGGVALVGVLALARSALARRFATGTFRPLRDHSAFASTTLLASVMCALLMLLGAPLARQLLPPIYACLVVAGAALVAERWGARLAPFAEGAILVLSLLVR